MRVDTSMEVYDVDILTSISETPMIVWHFHTSQDIVLL